VAPRKTKVSMAGERVGIFCMDPGRTTGLMWATITLKGSTKEIFTRDKPHFEHVDCNDMTVDREETELQGAVDIASLFVECQADWVLEGIGYNKQFFIYESFDLRGPIGSTAREGISPVRVTSTLRGLLIASKHKWVSYSASTSKSTITDQRLKNFGLWAVGKKHSRDAARQGATWVRQNI
jgi:hypothetical protein